MRLIRFHRQTSGRIKITIHIVYLITRSQTAKVNKIIELLGPLLAGQLNSLSAALPAGLLRKLLSSFSVSALDESSIAGRSTMWSIGRLNTGTAASPCRCGRCILAGLVGVPPLPAVNYQHHRLMELFPNLRMNF